MWSPAVGISQFPGYAYSVDAVTQEAEKHLDVPGSDPRVQKFNDLQALRMSQSLDYMRSLLEEFYRKRIIHI